MPGDPEHDQHVLETLEKEGGGLSYVLDPSRVKPSYCVSYGWSMRYGCEIIVFGTYTMALTSCPALIDLFWDQAAAGTPVMDGQLWEGADGSRFAGRLVDPSQTGREYFRDARLCRDHAAVVGDMPVYQLFWPDENGAFPWDSGYRGIEQPLLFDPRSGPE
ncbi:DUF4262 domain-containing protein [Sphingomonas parva]|uniref:DUF4262 domain-containing protein n=1 Tax=Sphingomonas parva TaxID=2555898 RepID=A0A4Y8ZNW6_9SPHN|nr:DUF4262 domain-containing protein [Sphingomonas parva]TFI57708.1 DUF4262 domain-containing protein [Sphingomonas parva]